METLSLNASLYRQFTTGYLKLSDILVTIRYFQNKPTRNKQIKATTNKQEATTALKQSPKKYNFITLKSQFHDKKSDKLCCSNG